MAKRVAIDHGKIAVRVIGPRDFSLFPRIQRLSIDFSQDVTDINELGNPGKAGISRGTPTVTVGLDTFEMGVRNIAVLAGVDPNAFPALGVEVKDLKEVDLALLVRDEDVADIVKAAYVDKASLREINWRFSVDGEAEENLSFGASRRVWFKGEVRTEKFTGGGTTATLTDPAIQLRNGNWLISVIADGQRLTETTGTPAAGEYVYDSGTLQITLGAAYSNQLLVSYQTSTAALDWVDVLDNTIPASTKGQDVKVVISANDIPRVQSVDIRVSFESEEVKEMGNRAVVGYQKKPPTVEGSITVLDTDTDLVELFSTGTLSSGYTEFEFGQGCAQSGLNLKIRVYDPCDPNQNIVTKTIILPAIEVVGDSYTANVGDLVQQVFNFRSIDGRVIIYSGLA